MLKRLATLASVTIGFLATAATSQVEPVGQLQSAASSPFAISSEEASEHTLSFGFRSENAASHTLTIDALLNNAEDVEYAYELEIIRVGDDEPLLVQGSHQAGAHTVLDIEPACDRVCEHDENMLIRVRRTDLGTGLLELSLQAMIDVQYGGNDAGAGDFVNVEFLDTAQ